MRIEVKQNAESKCYFCKTVSSFISTFFQANFAPLFIKSNLNLLVYLPIHKHYYKSIIINKFKTYFIKNSV